MPGTPTHGRIPPARGATGVPRPPAGVPRPPAPAHGRIPPAPVGTPADGRDTPVGVRGRAGYARGRTRAGGVRPWARGRAGYARGWAFLASVIMRFSSFFKEMGFPSVSRTKKSLGEINENLVFPRK
jgi:hypothetical protein